MADELLSRIFIPICKIDEEQRLVYGKMTFEAEDSSGEIWDYDGSKPYFEKWSENAEKTSGGKSLGNLRSMHQPIAAGKLTQFIMNDEDKAVEIAAKVVDDAEWEKVLEGVYTGFSQGGRYVKRWKDPSDSSKTRYISDPVEVSLVDLPCLPGATFEYVKADGSTEIRKFSTKETPMDPTNEQIEARAKELAKAAGDESKWLDNIEAARADLIAKAAGSDPVVEEPAASADAPVEGSADKAAAGDPPVGEAVEDTDTGGEGAGGELEIDAEKARKAAREAIGQVWKTTDGQTFAKCDDAVAHQQTLTVELAPPLSPVEAALKAARGEDEGIGGIEVEKFVPTEGLDVAVGTLGALVEKGLYSASRSLEVLQSVICLQSDAAWEADYEGDGSGVPGQLAAAARALGDAALAMVNEEVAEALASLKDPAVEIEILENAAQVEFCKGVLGNEDLMKAGARNSKKDQESIQKMHDESVNLGAKCAKDDEGGDADKALEPEQLQKRAESDPVVKHLLEKNNELSGEVEKAVAGIAELGKTIEQLKLQPVPMAPRTSVVGKKGDGGATDPELIQKAEDAVQELMKSEDGRRRLADAAIRASQATGGHRA